MDFMPMAATERGEVYPRNRLCQSGMCFSKVEGPNNVSVPGAAKNAIATVSKPRKTAIVGSPTFKEEK